MRPTPILLSFAILLSASVQPAAAADRIQKVRGTVLAIDGIALTVEVDGGASMSFAVSEHTRVEAPGAGTATRRAQYLGQRGVALADIVKRGNAVEVTYRQIDGINRASLVRRIRSTGGEAVESLTSRGKVTMVAPTTFTIAGPLGPNANFAQRFVVDSDTRVIGKGAGTIARESGGKAPITEMMSAGDSVTVSFKVADNALHAKRVAITTRASK
jgi:hypothetical protein